ncbi:MAG: Spo0E family sporulation regulatory protein-aspartic acid phosphatase [Clostridia bacterium]|nr:Spo0E family sporulation regulatory protein-aspartic acid phosphatase [Clostridia bacterium]
MVTLEQIKKEQEGLVILYEQSKYFLDAEILRKSQQLDKMIVSYLNQQIKKRMKE